MVPRVSQAGHSFKGAALYYLNDKGKRREDGRDAWAALRDELGDRVAHIETMNLPTDDAVMAIKHMIDTAQHADELKAAAGISNKGRKGAKPVYSYSLAWHPTERPSMAEQIDAAKATLKELGITDRQALIVAHNDTDHPHVHVIVNRVCPETGRMASMGNDRLKLSNWAEAYEKSRGHIFCKEREANNAKRDKSYVKDQSLTRQQWIAWKKGQTSSIWEQYKQDRAEAFTHRKPMYDALWRQKEEQFAKRKDEIKRDYKSVWREVFKRQREELKTFDAGFFGRVRVALNRSQNLGASILQALFSTSKLRDELIHDHTAERLQKSRNQKQDIADASRVITKAWKYDRDQLKALHKNQDKERLERARSSSDEIWKDKTRPTPEQAAEVRKAHPEPEVAKKISREKSKPQPEVVKKVDHQKDQPAPTKEMKPSISITAEYSDKGWQQNKQPEPKVTKDFEQKKDRRRPENKAVRSSMDTFYGEDKERLEKTRQRKQNRIERKKRERKRPRNRGRGREME